jgi:hypothetical protein
MDGTDTDHGWPQCQVVDNGSAVKNDSATRTPCEQCISSLLSLYSLSPSPSLSFSSSLSFSLPTSLLIFSCSLAILLRLCVPVCHVSACLCPIVCLSLSLSDCLSISVSIRFGKFRLAEQEVVCETKRSLQISVRLRAGCDYDPTWASSLHDRGPDQRRVETKLTTDPIIRSQKGIN